jgi:tetratricopeptide (TPR) repeat protein
MSVLSVSEALQLGLQLHQAKRPQEAERICRQILAVAPNHAESLNLLGILAGENNNPDAAVGLFRQAIAHSPDYLDAYSNLGCAEVARGRFADAISAFLEVTKRSPASAEAQRDLANAYVSAGQLDMARASCQAAIDRNPNYAEAYNDLGNVLKSMGQFAAAIDAYSRAVQLNPTLAEAYNNLGTALREEGRLDDAIAAYQKAIQIRPDLAVAHYNLGEAFSGAKKFEDALLAYAAAIDLNPTYVEAINNLGIAFTELQRYEMALRAYRRSAEIRPDLAVTHRLIGGVLIFLRDFAGSVANCRRSIELDPNSAEGWNALGEALRTTGDFAEATKCFYKAVELSPNNTHIYRNLSSIGEELDTQELQKLRGIFHNSEIAADERINAGFALGKLLDQLDNFDEAFYYYDESNRLFKNTRAQSGICFDRGELYQKVDRIIERFTDRFFGERSAWGSSSEIPVFIVGMPRSGTTLVEQIASSHPQVFGAGELSGLIGVDNAILDNEDFNSLQMWTPSETKRIADEHLAHLGGLAPPGIARIIDKMPAKVFCLGTVATLFPKARIIFCHREARDNCLSCYFQRFHQNNLLFSYDLADCGHQYIATHRVIDHWHQALPLEFLDIHYEELVADLESQSRRLIEFLGLPWDPACLQFDKSKRPVFTASVWQVRQPIYTRSVARWKHYERHLGPLTQVLNDAHIV